MTRKRKLKLLLVGLLFLLVGLGAYKIYLLIAERDYFFLNESNLARIEGKLAGRDGFTFSVVGNIKNSNKIFEKRLVPVMRKNGVDFMISAGNAVFDGAEDKYRAIFRSLSRMGLPYLLAFGENERADFGAQRFYSHFGPYYYSFQTGDAVFFFLDSTGQTSWNWQMRWLQKELASTRQKRYRFLILHSSPVPIENFPKWKSRDVLTREQSGSLMKAIMGYDISGVFSAGYPVFEKRVIDGIPFFNSGCGGGLLLDDAQSYQYLNVRVEPDGVTFENVGIPHRLGPVMYKLETLGLFLNSLFHRSLFNFLLIMGVLGLIALKVYFLILRQDTYYRDFSFDEKAFAGKPLRIAMFTDRYLPFLGGVPLSIHRLYKGLKEKGSHVRIFAPSYRETGNTEEGDIYRCPSLLRASGEGTPVANIFSGKIGRAFREFGCDLVHVHHPLWLGRKGMWLAKKHDIPLVFTYHTRLERYIHNIPIPGKLFKVIGAHYLIRNFANKCQAIITPTTSTEEYLRNLGVSSIVETIPTGVDMAHYRSWSGNEVETFRKKWAPEGILLVSVSRMALEKNLDFLIEGLRKVITRMDEPVHCILVGDGPERVRLEGKVKELGLEGRIHFTGSMAPVEVALGCLASDLFVFASTSETQGMVLLEAMAGGCPVVAVNASGVYDVVEDGSNGYKVPESTEIWADTILGLLKDKERLRILSANCREYARRYSEDVIAEKVFNLYGRVLVLHRSGGEG